MDTVNIKYIILVMMVLIASAEKQVKLKLKTTHCKNSCTHFHHKMCPSSIMVDNRERSSRKDGFNIVVINNYSGRVVARKYLQWFSNLMFWRKAEFKNFFQTIRHNSTVIIVFQNMCKSLETDWYTILSDLDHSITKRLYSSQAAIIACKGSCPDAVDEKIPYTYYSSGVKFEKDITLIFRAAPQPPPPPRYVKDENDIPVIVGSVTGAIIIVTICYAVYLYYRQRHPPDGSYYGSFPDHLPRDDLGRGGERFLNNRACTNNANPSNAQTDAIYEEIPQVEYQILPNGKRGNIYETIDPSEIKRHREQIAATYDVPSAVTAPTTEYDYPSSVSPEYEEPSQTKPSAPPLTPPSSPPITLYVSMDHLNEQYITKSTLDTGEKSFYI